ncbi:MAG TPA: DUF4476 domain-containing protein [Flavisolibacter sp.]|nr:DUF4476 domain-containing protein [Flavisolibacter sp.]
MKKVFLLLWCAVLSLAVSAQKVYFIYLQTEDQSPFYVRMGDKIYSSASSGYLILGNLVDTTYYLSLGYAKSNEAETKFSVALNQGDRGFLIKKFDDGPALFDFQEMSLVKSNETAKENTVYTTKTDNFSNLLSKAAGDPSLVKVPVKKEEVVTKQDNTKVEDVVKPADKGVTESAGGVLVATGSAAKAEKETGSVNAGAQPGTASESGTASVPPQQNPVQETTTLQPSTASSETASQAAYKPSTIIRRSESSTTEGFGLVFLDKYTDLTDTIRILIPNPKVKLVSETESKPADETMLTMAKVDSASVNPVTAVAANQTEVEKVAAGDQTVKQADNYNSSCNNLASEKDFLKLRRKMAGKESDEEMVNEARKEFKSRCFSVEQIKYLGMLFLTSAGRYQFFDAAYSHVSDKKNFASLSSEITDDYYLKRFKALVGE